MAFLALPCRLPRVDLATRAHGGQEGGRSTARQGVVQGTVGLLIAGPVHRGEGTPSNHPRMWCLGYRMACQAGGMSLRQSGGHGLPSLSPSQMPRADAPSQVLSVCGSTVQLLPAPHIHRNKGSR